MNKIQLIKAPLDDKHPSIDEWYLPLDLLHLAHAINNNLISVEILDGTQITLSDILKSLDPNAKFIGITYSALSIKSLKSIVYAAKELGLLVVLGGQAATGDCTELIKEPAIDIIVLKDGEMAVKALSELEDYSPQSLRSVPNLMFKNGHSIEKTQTVSPDLDFMDILPRNVGGIEPEKYISSYNKETHTLKSITASRPTNIYSKRGCPRNCSFCARVDKKVRYKSPSDVISEIIHLVDQYGIDYIVDISDTWIHKDWLDCYKNEYKQRISNAIPMTIFGDVRDITYSVCHDMKSVGIDNILLGIESGSERVLKLNRKILRRKSIVEAVRNLSLFDIKVSASFVIGLIGEDNNSLLETRSLCDELYNLGNVRCYCNVVIPLPGSFVWHNMLDLLGKSHDGCKSGFNYNLEISRQAFVNNFTNIDGGLKQLEDFRNNILEFNDLRILEYAR